MSDDGSAAARRLAEAGLTLPPSPVPLGTYSLAFVDGTLIHLAGHGPFATAGPPGQLQMHGRVGRDLSQDEGEEAARLTALSLLSSCAEILPSLDDLAGFLTLRVAVLAGPTCDLVGMANAASAVLAIAMPRARPPVRTVVGVAELPFGIPVVIEGLARMKSTDT
jgi:enamine deaminase RidA (YjgF/YER057c/UK114 family)